MAALKAHSMVDAIVDDMVSAMVVARAIVLNLVLISAILPSVFGGGGFIISVILLARLLIVED